MDAPDRELSDLLDFSAVCNQNYITYVYIIQYITLDDFCKLNQTYKSSLHQCSDYGCPME